MDLELALIAKKLEIENCFTVCYDEKIWLIPKPNLYSSVHEFLNNSKFKEALPIGRRVRVEICFESKILVMPGYITILGQAFSVVDINNGEFLNEIETSVMKEIENGWLGRLGHRKFKTIIYCDIEIYKQFAETEPDIDSSKVFIY